MYEPKTPKQIYNDDKLGVCKLKYYKAFEKNMVCRGKKYEAGKEYEEEGGEICHKGMMHFCETPFDTLDYYPLVDKNGEFSEFAEVEPLDEVEKKDDKRASRKIRIGAKLSFQEFIYAGVNNIIEQTGCDQYKIESSSNKAKIGSSRDWELIGSSRNNAQIGISGIGTQIGSSGDWVKIGSSGHGEKIGSSGDDAQIGSSGGGSRIGSSGINAQIGSSGNRANIGSSGGWARIGSSGDDAQIGSSGDGARIGSYGNRARIGSSGDGARIRMTGARSIAAAVGAECAISGKKGDWIVLAEWKQDEEGQFYPACVKTGMIDGETLKEDTMYTLKDGEFVEEY